MMLWKATTTKNHEGGPDPHGNSGLHLQCYCEEENRERFNYSIHGKGISAAGLICHPNNVQLKRENASIILLLEYPSPGTAPKDTHADG